MTAMNLPSYTPPEPKVEDDDKEHVKLRVAVFCDGTLNNRANVNARLVTVRGQEDQDNQDNQDQDNGNGNGNGNGKAKPTLTAEERKAAEELLAKMSPSDRREAAKAYQKHGAPPPADGENSYEGFYSNVAKMEPHVHTAPGGDYHYKFATYVEGVGTEDQAGDQLPGYAFGTSLLAWRAGILDKVEKAMRDVVGKIGEQVTPDSNLVIDELTLDVFGFSRGAAGARKLIHEAQLHRDTRLSERLEEQGYTVIKVKVCFVGLHDTVSTYGSGLVGAVKVMRGVAKNVEELNLNAVAHAEEALHLTAADEHRFHFSLTDIRSAGGRGKEFSLPGAHSDVGGGYRDTQPETLTLRGTQNASGVLLQGNYPSLGEAERERAQLIEAGWYTEQEIFVDPVLGDDGEVRWARLWVTRGPLSNQYSKIPLHIMARQARAKGMVFKDDLDRDEKITDPFLIDVKQSLEGHAAGASKSDAGYWIDNHEPWLKELRHKYLHFSARMQVGHDPRFAQDGRRQRYLIDG